VLLLNFSRKSCVVCRIFYWKSCISKRNEISCAAVRISDVAVSFHFTLVGRPTLDFSDVQIVYKFLRWMTPNLRFKVTVLFTLKYLENGTKQIYLQWQTDTEVVGLYDLTNVVIFSDLGWTLIHVSRTRHYSTLNISETIQDWIVPLPVTFKIISAIFVWK